MMAQYRSDCKYRDNCLECEYRQYHNCSAPKSITDGGEPFRCNKALAEELEKRIRFIGKAHQQILVGNYGIAKKLLGKVLYDPLEIKIDGTAP